MGNKQSELEPHEEAQKKLVDIATFRGSREACENHVLPEIAARRKTTDVTFLIIFILFLLVASGFQIYTAGFKSDIRRLVHGYDKCGNVCGLKNERVDGISCSGQDMTNKPFLNIDFAERSWFTNFETGYCASECDQNHHYEYLQYRCSSRPPSLLIGYKPVLDVTLKNAGKFVGIGLFALGMSALAVALVWFFPAVFTWAMLFLPLAVCSALTVCVWYFNVSLFIGMVITICEILLIFTLWGLRSRIKSTILLLQEAINIVVDMPLLALAPVLTILLQILCCAVFVYVFFLTITAGDLKIDESTRFYAYIKNSIMSFTDILIIIMYSWIMLFLQGCQQMVISGAVVAGYFTRDRSTLASPIYNSFYNLVRFHLGSVALSSFLLTLIKVWKIITGQSENSIEMSADSGNDKSETNSGCSAGQVAYNMLLEIIKYLITMGYILIAIHGQSQWKSGNRAMNLVNSNFLTAVSVDSIFFLAKFLITLLTVGLTVLTMGIEIVNNVLLIMIVTAFGYVCADSCFTLIQVALRTVFICYCEDQLLLEAIANTSSFSPESLHIYFAAVKADQIREIEKRRNKKPRCVCCCCSCC